MDYTLHFIRTFIDLPAQASSKDRTIKGLFASTCVFLKNGLRNHPLTLSLSPGSKAALGHVGSSILMGGLSTMLALLPLAGTDSKIFFTFFILLISTVGFGLFSGLAFMPVILSSLPQSIFSV